MKSTVYSSKLKGTINPPSSKSYAQRALLIAALAEHNTRLIGLGQSDDVKSAIGCALALGAKLEEIENGLLVVPNAFPRKKRFVVGDSGFTGRVMSSILLLMDEQIELSGGDQLSKRPFWPIIEAAQNSGREISSGTDSLPLSYHGSFKAEELTLNSSLSSQFLSGLLIAGSHYPKKLKINAVNLKSRPYVEMTLDMIKLFGRGWSWSEEDEFELLDDNTSVSDTIIIESDWSAIAQLLACSIGQNIEIKNVHVNSKQADRKIVEILNIPIKNACLVGPEQCPEFHVDITNCPDLAPALASMAVFSSGACSLSGIHRLKHKESNRALAIKSEFEKLGIRVEIRNDKLIVFPGRINGGIVDSHGDHRMSMALTALGLKSEKPVTILNSECVSKSYPKFFDDLCAVGANIQHFES